MFSWGRLSVGNTPQLVRTDEYTTRLVDLAKVDQRLYRRVMRMERALVAAHGFPAGSFAMIEQLRRIPQETWQEIVDAFALISPESPMLALTYIEHQRVMRRYGITLVYCTISLGHVRRIILLDVISSAAPMWGAVMRRIYDLTTIRKK